METEEREVWENLAEWDNLEDPLAPLTEEQQITILELAAICDQKLSVEDDPTEPKTNTLSQNNAKRNADTTILDSFASLMSGEKTIESSQQFYQWYSELEWEMLQEEDAEYRAYLAQLEKHQGDCQEMLQQVTGTLDKLSKLNSQYGFVSNKTTSLHEACEQMLIDQTKLSNLADELENKISYFLEYEKIQSQLSSPTLSVHGELFRNILDRLDKCIDYMQSHPQYRETSTYVTKYRVCLNTALSSVRSWVLQALEQCVQQAKKPDGSTPTTGESYAFTLLYGKFRLHADKMKQLMTDIEQRHEKGPEYEQLLADCHAAYFSQRLLLLRPSVVASLTDLSTTYVRDHCALSRCSCTFLLRICHDEWQLYHQFFGMKSELLEDYMDQLCGLLYDLLRPHIIHSNHLETLAELCFILRVEMIDEHINNNPEQLSAFHRVVLQLLSDVQERLVYRAHIYVQNDIVGYKPVSGDLAYPEKLEMMESIAEGLQNQATQTLARSVSVSSVSSPDTVRSHTGNSPADLHGMWYPPLRRALLCLSKLYRSVDRSTFQGLSQEVLAAACAALANASSQIMSNKTTLDAHLFHIKHLLILREQIAPFQVDFAVKEMSLDFSSVKHAALGLFQKKGRLFSLSASNALLEFLLEGAPQVREHLKDSRRLADRQLKSTCEAFIDYCGDFLIGPIRVYLAKMTSYLKNNTDLTGLKQQTFAQPDVVQNYSSESQKYLRTRLPVVQRSLQLYLANRETEFILFRPVKNLIVASFQQLHQILVTHYSEEERGLIAAPSPEHISILLSAMLLKRPESVSGEREKTPDSQSPAKEPIHNIS
ncbi:conserved oligomeric Golgi complex subunit 3-like [Daphnia carinata]|uniref:conserved oligomeric Golgi complex subunit 3-like n=1 Tax=Daphnia carinata TaxID=120202 RepID=UPI00257CAA1C|nr:conserved oligomeric Golgi complex subunit 3-like [Daphnia carinata]